MEYDNTEQNYLVHLVAIIIIIIMLRKEALAFFLLLLLQIVIHLWLEKVFPNKDLCMWWLSILSHRWPHLLLRPPSQLPS